MKFGTDGVRGRFGDDVTPQYVARLARAAASVVGGETWLIGRDTRESGPVLEAAFTAGLRAAGAVARSLGVVPTPILAAESARLDVPAAMITASHNPFHDNGVKIFAAGGVKLPDDIERSIEAALGDRPAPNVLVGDVLASDTEAGGTKAGDTTAGVTAHAAYGERIRSLFPVAALAGMRIVVDGANGAMSHIAPSLVAALGAEVSVIHVSPNGRNINDGCGATAPGSLAAAVVDRHADLGLAFDGDGDRVIAVDHLGRVVDGDRLLALAALQLRSVGQLVDDTVVVTVMSNLGFMRAMERAGITVVATAVGDRYVLEALDANGWALGGEQSGHIIYRKLATTGDGLLAGLRLAQHVRESGQRLAELADAVMTSYPQVLLNVRVADRHPHAADELAAEISSAQESLAGEGRILVRASGTEPLIRVMVEAATADLARQVAERLVVDVSRRFG